jgi:uncharacterized membrane protein
MIKVNKMSSPGWLIIIGLQLAIVITGYVALESGENEEDVVEKVVSKKLIHEHEEAAEIFVGSAVISLVLSVAVFFIRKDIGFLIKMGIVFTSLVSCFLAYRTGKFGGELVYKHGAASAYSEDGASRLLPTPGINTSESAVQGEENESLKPDENEYGYSDDAKEASEEDSKQED